ncbi:MAG TPA: methylated-DNA--[protein]-cysteine S-methyltransferase [Rhodanobacteraceae bacterium]|jgi:methylated-DNA-[protein]-cysteine S-methyltransferase|nr:methylated-DNA--[protein]-cysteine S-methyltransferase [Rhodanobacteraceae bacterium]
MNFHDHLESPIGPLLLVADEGGLTYIGLPRRGTAQAAPDDARHAPAKLRAARHQFDEYFSGTRHAFDLPLHPHGTPFQLEVWGALLAIPYGETTSYAVIAQRIGRPNAVRAVGAANGANPLSIIVPCHRVIGSDGDLTGYGGGLPAKRWLLAHERMHAPRTTLVLEP